MTGRTVVHLVPHTHWDREWYEPFQTFRIRLVDLIDQLLDRMERDSRLRFTLDGQAATVDDYLEVRPEAEPLIRQLIAERRLAIGPWQILMDEFLVSGETIVRNLQLGWARAEELGAAMPVGYLPDMFGHIAQMPQILARAGIRTAVVWRGVPAAINRNTFMWRSPDGSAVRTEYLVGGYGNGAHLFDVPDRLGPKLTGYRIANAAFYGDRSVLAMYGTDHAVPSPRLADLVEQVNNERDDVEVRIETLADYATREGDAAGSNGAEGAESAKPVLEWTGELRSGARANMLMGVASARVDLKAACARAERLLDRYAEPLTALHGGPWPARLLELAWRRVVDNSAHDSICGCSHDDVVDQVMTRFAEAEQIGQGIVRATLRQIASNVERGRWVVVNPSPADREDLVELDLSVPLPWDAAALRSGDRVHATQEIRRSDPIVASLRLHGAEIPDLFRRRRHGRELFGLQINGAITHPGDAGSDPRLTVLVEDVADPPELDVDELLQDVEAAVLTQPEAEWDVIVRAPDRRRLVVRVPVDALAWSQFEIVDAGESAPEAIDSAVVVDGQAMTNGLVSVGVSADGTFSLVGGGSELSGVGRIVDGGDFGDSYNYGPPTADLIVDDPAEVSVAVTAGGPLRGTFAIVRSYDWPDGLVEGGLGRSSRMIRTDVTTTIELRAGERFVRVRVDFENRSRDHRVRWHIPLPRPVTGSAAEGQFAVVDRGLELEGGHGEIPLPTFPARGFVHVEGLTVLLDQITEYEVVGGQGLALTLLRSFGLISRNANPYREDPAGPEVPVPGAQLVGQRTIGFALAPHSGSWSEADSTALAERYQHPFLVCRGTAAPGKRGGAAGLRIAGHGVVLSALRRHDDWLEVRLVLQRPTPIEAVLTGMFDVAREVDLLGRDLGELACADGQLRLPMTPWSIRTVRLLPVSG